METRSGLLLGTVGYMSPEQLRGGRPSTSWDLWALAVTAYEMLTGELPYPVSPAAACYKAVLDGQMTALHTFVPEAPASWQQFFDRVLAARVEPRPASPFRFFSDFKQHIQ